MDDVEDRGALIFEWKESRTRPRLRIVWFLIVAALLHAAFFYVFRVVYPSTSRGMPIPSRVLLLSSDDPNVQALLAEVDDRTAAYSPDLGVEVIEPQLIDYTRYVPSFAEYQPGLKDFPVRLEERLPLPDAIGGAVQLPEVEPLPEPIAAPPERLLLPPGPTEPVLAIGGSLSDRPVVNAPDLTGIFEGTMDARAVFTIGVDASGSVRFCLADEEFQADQSEALRRAASQANFQQLGERLFALRFEPDASRELTWGFASIEW